MFSGRKAQTVAMPKPAALLERPGSQPEGLWYSAKRRLLGPPLVNDQLGEQRLLRAADLLRLPASGVEAARTWRQERAGHVALQPDALAPLPLA